MLGESLGDGFGIFWGGGSGEGMMGLMTGFRLEMPFGLIAMQPAEGGGRDGDSD